MIGEIFRSNSVCRAPRAVRLPGGVLITAAFLACLALLGSVALGQNTPINPPAGFGQVPQGTGACSVEKSCSDLAPLMIQSALGPSPLEDNLRTLTDSIGGRVTGSPAAGRAVAWAIEALRHAGVDEVHTEKFTVAAGWSEEETRVDVLSPAPFPVRLVSGGWSPPTPAGGITADIVDIGTGDEAGFTKAGAAVKGAILLMHSTPLVTWDDLDREYDVQPGIIERARKSGAAAIFWMSTRPNLLLYRHTTTSDGRIEALPQAIVAREDAERIARFLAAGQKVRVHFEMPNRVSGPVESENVVGEIRGREKPDEFVLLGAHLDSWDLGTGAEDNGVNAALVIDLARAFHDLGVVPRRTLRFALFTGEEQGMLGSQAYVEQHKSELDRFAAVMIFDTGSGHLSGFYLNGRNELRKPINSALDAVEGLRATTHLTDVLDGTDNFDFLISGVPNLVGIQDPIPYLPDYHSESDTFDRVNQREEKVTEAVAAVLMWGLAENPERPASRQTRAEVEKLITDTKLDEQMKAFGQWDDFKAGKRGWSSGAARRNSRQRSRRPRRSSARSNGSSRRSSRSWRRATSGATPSRKHAPSWARPGRRSDVRTSPP